MAERHLARTAAGSNGASPKPALLQAWLQTLGGKGRRRAILEAATGKACTFQELDERAEAWRRKHVPDEATLRGRAVVFALANGITWMETFLGLAKAGAVIVPLDAGEPIESQQRIARAVRAGFWWHDNALLPVAARETASGDNFAARRFREPAPALMKLTSGTTDEPRVLPFMAEQMLADARQVTSTMGIRATDLNYALIPLGHSYGLGNLTIPLLAHGVPMVCGSAAWPQAIADDFRRWRPTVFPSVPAIWRTLTLSDVLPSAFRSLRRGISAGAPLPAELARDFAARFGQRIHSFYGTTETGGIAFDRTGVATLRGGVGSPLNGVSVRVRRGKLHVCSPAVFTLGNRRREHGCGCWTPADRATIDDRGEITLLGRVGGLVKIAGRRVDLNEVAARLRRVRGVREVWVGTNDSAEPMMGAAVATTRTASELRAELLVDTPPWKIPKRWICVSALPLTERGKVDTRVLRQQVFGRTESGELKG